MADKKPGNVWSSRIEKAEKFMRKAWGHGDLVYNRYEDKREGSDSGSAIKKVNLFYANVNTLKESLFNSLPKADVKKIHNGNYNDDVSRVACLIAARVLDYETECAPDFRESIDLAVLERLVPGMGQLWCSFDLEEDEETGDPIPGTEHIVVEHVFWSDFIYEPAKRWSKVTWVGRRIHFNKHDFVERFGEDALSKVGAPGSDRNADMNDVNKDKICVYEIWDKKSKKVSFIYKGMEEPLLELDDPYKLNKFFPCPRPLIANVNSRNFLPVTDYHLAQDQYSQCDVLYARISLIIDAVKVAGLYDSSATEIGRMLQEGENKLIPVDNWAMHSERGGAAGMIDWYPVDTVVKVLRELQVQFEAIKGILSEVSGMSDIVRGDSNQYETAKAQQIKAQFASVRMNGYQRDVAVFVRDTMRIMADLAFGLYSDQKLIEIVGDLEEPDKQFVPAAAQLLRSDLMSKYKVNIQADSLTQADWALEKGQKQELVQVLGAMIGQTMQMVEQVPEMAMLAVQMIKFAVSGYKGASELEGWIDQQLDQMARKALQTAQNPQPKPPSEAEQKAQGEMQKLQMEAQIAQQQAQMDLQAEQTKAAMEERRMEMEMAHQQQMNDMELQMKTMELQMKQREAAMKMQTKVAETAITLDASSAKHQQDSDQAQEKHEAAMLQAAQKPKPGAGGKK